MSKNTRESKFRDVNVDKFDEENYVDDETAVGDLSDVTARESAFRKLLNTGSKLEALKLALENPPMSVKETEAKVWKEKSLFAVHS